MSTENNDKIRAALNRFPPAVLAATATDDQVDTIPYSIYCYEDGSVTVGSGAGRSSVDLAIDICAAVVRECYDRDYSELSTSELMGALESSSENACLVLCRTSTEAVSLSAKEKDAIVDSAIDTICGSMSGVLDSIEEVRVLSGRAPEDAITPDSVNEEFVDSCKRALKAAAHEHLRWLLDAAKARCCFEANA